MSGARVDTKNNAFRNGLHELGSYLWKDILKPSIYDTIYDIVTNGLSMVLWDNKKGRKGDVRSKGGITMYNYSTKSGITNRNYNPNGSNPEVKTAYDGGAYYTVILKSASDVGELLDKMEEFINDNGKCTIADLLWIVRQSSTWTDNYYGWNDISLLERVRNDRSSYRITGHGDNAECRLYLPKPVPVE